MHFPILSLLVRHFDPEGTCVSWRQCWWLLSAVCFVVCQSHWHSANVAFTQLVCSLLLWNLTQFHDWDEVKSLKFCSQALLCGTKDISRISHKVCNALVCHINHIGLYIRLKKPHSKFTWTLRKTSWSCLVAFKGKRIIWNQWQMFIYIYIYIDVYRYRQQRPHDLKTNEVMNCFPVHCRVSCVYL